MTSDTEDRYGSCSTSLSSPHSPHPQCQHRRTGWTRFGEFQARLCQLNYVWHVEVPDHQAPTQTKHVGSCRHANESFEQCRTTAQWTSLATSGIEDPVWNSYFHSQHSQHRHTIVFIFSAEPAHSTASLVQLKSPHTTTLKNEIRLSCISHAAPLIWNGLPADVRSSPSFQTFKKMLKTYYFRNAPT